MEDVELFKRYFVVGKIYGSWCQLRIDTINADDLSATGTSMIDGGGFEDGEKVIFHHCYSEIWRATSERNDHGQGIFLGEHYSDGGFGIGS